MTIKLFISYSHKDEEHRKALETHLARLKDNKLIETWHDRKIGAGASISNEIRKNMQEAKIILLLFSPAFIESKECKKEMVFAKDLKKEKGTMIIPIILHKCSWQEEEGMDDTLALPKDGKHIVSWEDPNEAWHSVYCGIKTEAEKIREKILPQPNDEFRKNLLSNSSSPDSALDKIFVYPDLLKHEYEGENVSDMTIDSEKLMDIDNLPSKYVLIAGEEQIGKTSLCKMLYVSYLKKDLYPVMIHGRDIAGKAEVKSLVKKGIREQYQETSDDKYWGIDLAKRVLLIDDIHERKANWENYVSFIESVKEKFGCVIVFIDNLTNLSDKSVNHDRFSFFKGYTIKEFGHSKKGQLIKKLIKNDLGDFDSKNEEHMKRLERDTNHINSIIGTNLVPSYPVFIIPAITILEVINPSDMSKTSYGHCYHAMITIQLHRSKISPNDMDAYFNFLKYLAYHLFEKKVKSLSTEELESFRADYSHDHITAANLISNLEKSGIIKKEGDKISFGYIYIYYYFVAEYIAENIDASDVKKHIEKLTTNIHKKDNANIIIFTAHHSKKAELLDDILVNCMVTFDSHSEATLEKTETQFIAKLAEKLEALPFPSEDHDAMETREKALQNKDKNQPAIDKAEESMEADDDELVVSILKSAKSMDILGQIMKNQYGSFRKEKLRELFVQGQNVGLRLIKSYIDLMSRGGEQLEAMLQDALLQAAKRKGKKLSEAEARERSRYLIGGLSHIVIYGWLLKIVHSLGYEKLIEIADEVHDKAEPKTVASKLINFSIHTWYEKDLKSDDVKALVNEFRKDNNHVAEQLLHSIVAHYLYMHNVPYSERQSIEGVLKVSAKGQIIKHGKIYQNKK